MNPPTLFIIAGPNGAGKTTASMNILPEILDCKIFVNADEIAKGLNPLDPESMAIEAGRIMLNRINFLIEKRETFALETTLATRSYLKFIEKAKDLGYKVVLLFFWLESPDFAKERVTNRVKEGGHNIPEEVIERRYWLGLKNLFEIFMLKVDSWSLYDNNDKTKLISTNLRVVDVKKYKKIKESCQNRK
ncbi:MAG: zeta toxin family protein [Muribaculaceae bacterium]|nr:zeta toxin family protein [Muribaculaceae bacterium]